MFTHVQAKWKEQEQHLQDELEKLRVTGEYVDVITCDYVSCY